MISVDPFVGTVTVVNRSSVVIVGCTSAPLTVAVISESVWTYWRSPTTSWRVSNFCDTSGGTAPVRVMVCFTFSVPSLARLPSAMNVDAVPSACAVNASGPASRPQAKRQNAIIDPTRRSVLSRLASTRYSLPLVVQSCRCMPKNGGQLRKIRDLVETVAARPKSLIEKQPLGLVCAVIVARVSQQQWSGPQYAPPRGGPQAGSASYAPYGSARGWPAPSMPTGGYYQGYPSQGFGRSSFGGGVPQYGPTPPMPAPRRRSPLRMLLGVIIIVTLMAIAGLAITGLSSEPATTSYANDNYEVPPPDTNPPPLP